LNLKTNQQEPLMVKGRHDPVLGPRAVAVVEAMALLVIGDLVVRGGFADE
jgi:chorismate synthase